MKNIFVPLASHAGCVPLVREVQLAPEAGQIAICPFPGSPTMDAPSGDQRGRYRGIARRFSRPVLLSRNTVAIGCSRPRRAVPLKTVTMRLPLPDIKTAQDLAHEKGLPYQTYIKLLLQEALKKERSA